MTTVLPPEVEESAFFFLFLFGGGGGGVGGGGGCCCGQGVVRVVRDKGKEREGHAEIKGSCFGKW